MSADPDSCLPAPVKNFVFDLHDSAFRSLLVSEQSVLYNGTFRDLSSKVCLFVFLMGCLRLRSLEERLMNIAVASYSGTTSCSISRSQHGHLRRPSQENVTMTPSS
jgi:hypothetical protein